MHHRSSLVFIGSSSTENFDIADIKNNKHRNSKQLYETSSNLGTHLFGGASSTGLVNGTAAGFSSTSIGPNCASPNSGLGSSSPVTTGASETSSSCFGQIRPNCLSRRTSYRTNQKVAIPVATPMSPVEGPPLASGRGSECSFEIKSPSQQSVLSSNSSSSCCISPLGSVIGMQSQLPRMMMRRYPTLPEDESCSENGSIQELHSRGIQFNKNNSHANARLSVFEPQLKTYESLKSQMSNSSQGSTGTQMTSSSTASENSSVSRNDISSSGIISGNSPLQPMEDVSKRSYHPPHHHGNKMLTSSLSQPISIDTSEREESLAEETIKGLSFVSPKSGVYRPMPDGRRQRQNCIVM